MKQRIIFLGLILLVVAGLVVYKNWRHDFLRKKIPRLVFLRSDSVYRITYGDLYLDEVEGEVIIKDLQLHPDTTFKKKDDPELPRNLLRIIVPELHITGVRTDAAILNKEITATKISLTRPVVTMYTSKGAPALQKNDSTSTTYGIYKVLLRGLEKISVDTILIAGADYHICKWKDGDTVFTGKSIDAKLYHLNISDSTSTDTSRILFAKQASLEVEKVRLRDKQKRYNFMLSGIELHSIEKTVAIKDVSIVPLLNEAAFMRASKWQTDRLNINFTGLTFTGTNIPDLLNGNLVAGELTIGDAVFKVFRDKSYPLKKVNKVGRYPHQLFAGIPVAVALNKMTIRHGYIEYKEKNPKTASSGHIQFNNVQATLYNVTNRMQNLQRNSVCTVRFKSLFLNKVPLSAVLKLHTGSTEGKFTIRGTLGTVNASFYNILTRPLAMMEISSGTVNSLDFTLNCNNYSGNGTIRLLYDDLKIKLLKPGEENKNKLEPKKFASLIANVAIKNANLGKNKPVRIVRVAHPRDVNKSMFNLIWKSIFEGLQKTVGIEGKLPL